MYNKKYLVILLIAILSNFLSAQQEKLKTSEWINNWYLLGPIQLEEGSSTVSHLGGFETDYLSKHGGETNPEVKIGQAEQIGNTTLTWFEYTSPDSTVNLDKAVSKRSFVVAYAYKELAAEKEGTYILSLGTNDGGRLWINGVEVWDYPGARGLKADEDLIPVFLKKGKNKILLKVEERGNNWGFAVRILPFNIDTFTRRGKLFKVVTLPSGVSELRFSLTDQVIENLFTSVDLDIYTDDISKEPVWSGEWTKKEKMKLDIKDNDYSHYLLKIDAHRKDGKEWNTEIPFASGKRIDYSLFDNEKTDYKIIVGENASES